MKMKAHPLLAIAFLALAACRPAATEWTESEASKHLRLDDASVAVTVRFAPGSAHLLPADAARLRAMAATGAIQPSDRVAVATRGGASEGDLRMSAKSGLFDALGPSRLAYDCTFQRENFWLATAYGSCCRSSIFRRETRSSAGGQTAGSPSSTLSCRGITRGCASRDRKRRSKISEAATARASTAG